MRNPLISCLLLALIACSLSCAGVKVSDSGYAEKALVTRFINLWIKSSHETRLNAFIAPSYLKTNKISLEDHKVNNFAPADFTLEYYNKGIVTARIWGENHKWEHRILFEVIKYKGKLYLYPSKHNKEFVDPWYSVSFNINQG